MYSTDDSGAVAGGQTTPRSIDKLRDHTDEANHKANKLDPRRLPEKETRVKVACLEKTAHSFKKVIITILPVSSTKDQQMATLDHTVVKAGEK